MNTDAEERQRTREYVLDSESDAESLERSHQETEVYTGSGEGTAQNERKPYDDKVNITDHIMPIEDEPPDPCVNGSEQTLTKNLEYVTHITPGAVRGVDRTGPLHKDTRNV